MHKTRSLARNEHYVPGSNDSILFVVEQGVTSDLEGCADLEDCGGNNTAECTSL